MARFLGNASGRTIGAPTGASGFTKAKIFSNPGTTTFTVPQDVSKLKVFVVGSGSSFRTGTYAFCGACCNSGVSYPASCYCACFSGHLTGAGGGYAEKTYLQSADRIAGKTLTISVGSIGGLSASSVSSTGITTVTASNATEAAYSWACTSNSTARDNSNDNPISIGIQLPVCGYVNCFSGYYNNGGTASGGDINRVGGKGVLIPEFLKDSYLDGLTCTNVVSSNSATCTASCWKNPTVFAAYAGQWHYQFGSNTSGNSTVCACLCCIISGLCYGTAAGSQCLSSRYSFLGKETKLTASGNNSFYGSETDILGVQNYSANKFIKDVPIGVGAQSGNSLGTGKNGYSDLVLTNACISPGGSNLSTSPTCYGTGYNTSGYDFSFGGSLCSFVYVCYNPGCYSANNCLSRGSSASFCYTQDRYVYSGWTSGSSYYVCQCWPHGLASADGGNGYACFNRNYNLGFINDPATENPQTDYVINLSTLTDENGLNIGDIAYGRGAGISTSASYGGGGNRLYPNGGSGLVVVIY